MRPQTRAAELTEEAHILKKHLLAPLALVAAVAFTGCSVESAASVKEKADSDSAGIVVDEADAKNAESTDSGSDEADTEPAAEEVPATASLGDTVEVGDWDVTVTQVALNANRAIAQSNMFNDKPKGQYVLVTYKAKYNGADRTADINWGLDWSFTGTNSRVYDPAMAVTPADNKEWPTEVRKGGVLKQLAVFDLKGKVIKGGTLTVESMTPDFETVYADFTV